jgi:recombination protein RecT
VFTRTPALLECDPVSIARAIVEASQLGLEPTGLMGGAYLVPRGKQATLLVGYRGLVILAKRSGEVQRVEARVVRAKDTFEYGYGLDPYLRHVPSQEADPGPFSGAYAVIFYRDGSRQFDYMPIVEIEAIRKRSASPDRGPWVTDYAEMVKKTPLRRLMKMAPLTVQAAAKIDELDPEVDMEPASPAERAREAELKRELQTALEREYGHAPSDVTDGQFREAPPENGQAAGAGTPSGEAGAAEGTQVPSAGAAAGQGAPADSAPAGAPAPQASAPPREPGKPESVAQVLGTLCGTSFEPLDVGPCTLPKGHDAGPWRTTEGEERAKQQEHEDQRGQRWSQPKQ